MAFGCIPGDAQRLVMRGAVLALALAGSVGLLRAQSETIVNVPPGTYDLSAILTQGGTASNRIRYRPATPGSVIIRGGGTVNRSHVTLEGFLFDGTLNPRYGGSGVHTIIIGSNIVGVRIEQSDLKASAHDIHTGFEWGTNTFDCSESGALSSATGISVNSGAHVTLADSVLHGAYNVTNHMNGAFLRIERTLVRNNFNGLQVGSDSTIEFVDSVLWDHPNHPIIVDSSDQATLLIDNSVIVNGQNTVRTVGELGGSHVIVRHSTFYTPDRHPCGSDAGIDPTNVRQQVVIQNTLVAVNANNWWRANSSQLGFYQSNYNLGWHWDSSGGADLRLDGSQISLAQWRTATKLDLNTIRARPVFADAPDYVSPLPTTGSQANQWGFRVPTSVAQVRGWFTLQAGSPGKGAGSDGKDIGIAEGAGGGGTFGPRPPTNLRIIR
jgi:hypothetical protein